MSGFLGGGIGPVALKRRRAAGITPDQIAGLQLWLKADAIVGLADGDAIATWTDSSGNGRNATQATAGAQPTYRTGILNGRPVIRLDGSDDFMTVADSAALETATLSVFVVIKGTIDRDYESILDKWSANLGWMIDFNVAPSMGRPRISVGAASSVTWSASVSGAWSIIAAIINGATSGIGVNGGIATGALAGTIANSQDLYIGGDNISTLFVSADIAEIIIYNSALSDANRQAVEAYLSAKYGIALA